MTTFLDIGTASIRSELICSVVPDDDPAGNFVKIQLTTVDRRGQPQYVRLWNEEAAAFLRFWNNEALPGEAEIYQLGPDITRCRITPKAQGEESDESED